MLPCGAESPYRGGDDNSGSARSTDATWVPSEIWGAESIPLSLWFFFASSYLLSAVLTFSCVRECSWKKAEYVTMEWEVIGCHQFPTWHWDHSLNTTGTCENHTNSTWLLHALIRCPSGRFPPKVVKPEHVILRQLRPLCDSANSQLMNSSLPAVCAHLH